MTDTPHPSVVRGRDALARGDLRAAIAAADERLRSDARDIAGPRNPLSCPATPGRNGARNANAAKCPRDRSARGLGLQRSHPTAVCDGPAHRARTRWRATALRMNPRNAEAHNLFGTLLSESNDLPSGEWHFRRALELGGEKRRFPDESCDQPDEAGQARRSRGLLRARRRARSRAICSHWGTGRSSTKCAAT